MKAMLEKLVRGVLVAVTMVLAGCVADASDSDEETTNQGSEALVLADGTRVVAPLPRTTQVSSSIAGSIGGTDRMGEPEPNPWAPEDDDDTAPIPSAPTDPNAPNAGQKK
jgi:hypothetical protein